MSWQSKIYHKYRFDEKCVKIITDYTGILVHQAFLDFLNEEKKPYSLVKTVPEILSKLTTNEIIIIGQNLEIPAFVSSKTEVINFHFSDIPYNGNTGILSTYSTENVITLLSYIDEKLPHFVITESGIQHILDVATEYALTKELAIIKNKITSLTNKPLSLDNILSIAQLWAEITYQSYLLNNSDFITINNKIDSYCNSYFIDGTWQEAFFAPIANPKTIDKILHKIKYDKASKRALLCFDCMGLPEWLLLKDYLKELEFSITESALFSLLPSITSIARSAIFSGSYEVYNRQNPGQATEEKDFKDFFDSETTLYIKDKDFTSTDVLIGYNTISVLYNFFDELSHSTKLQENNLNKFGYYSAVKNYLKNSKVKQKIKDLLELEFTIYICSDHGSTIACGNGNKIDKYLHDKFAKRATLISKDSANLTEYKKINIPFIDDKLVVIPENREMFANRNQYEINHGGITIEEMVVPFIKISNKH